MCKHGLHMRALMGWDCHSAAPARVFVVVDNGGRAPPVCGVVVAVCRTHSCGELRPSRVAMASRGLDIPVQPACLPTQYTAGAVECTRARTQTRAHVSFALTKKKHGAGCSVRSLAADSTSRYSTMFGSEANLALNLSIPLDDLVHPKCSKDSSLRWNTP